MRATPATATTVAAVLIGLAGARIESALAQASVPAPSQSVPGIIITPGITPEALAPRTRRPSARDGAPVGQSDGSERDRAQPHGGCQYDERRLELIV